MSAHIQKRDTSTGDVEITTPNLLDSFKNGLQKTFSDENINVSFLGLISSNTDFYVIFDTQLF